MNIKKFSLFNSISTKFALLALVLICMFIGVLMTFAISELKKNLVGRANTDAELLSNLLREIILCEMEHREPDKLLSSALENTNIISRVYNTKGKLLKSSIKGEKKEYKNIDVLLQLFHKDLPSQTLIEGNFPNFTKVMPLYNRGECSKCHSKDKDILGVFEVKIPLQKAYISLSRMQKNLLIAGGATILFLILSLIFIFKLFFKRLDKLKEKMAHARNGDLTVRFEAKSSDEIGNLGKSFNKLLEELESTRNELQEAHQKELQHMEKLAAVGELAAGVVHEVRNPLAAVSATIQALRHDLTSDDPQRELFDKISNETNKINKVLLNVLQFARQEEPNFQLIEIEPCIREVLALIKGQIKGRQAQIILSVEPNLPMIRGDEKLLQQVFLNIILNAVQAQENGLKVEIALKNDSSVIKIIIRDNGPGIAKENLERIFKPFYSTKPSGTGLGLSISKDIITRHNGRIEAQSEPGKGSAFIISLPSVEVSPKPNISSRTSVRDKNSPLVLK